MNPADGRYVIGSPLVSRATITPNPRRPERTFTIVARDVSNQNIYVQLARLNGKRLEPPWITHEDVIRGGMLELQMGITPVETGAPGH